MANDEHEALIKKAAQAIRIAYAKEMYDRLGTVIFREEFRA